MSVKNRSSKCHPLQRNTRRMQQNNQRRRWQTNLPHTTRRATSNREPPYRQNLALFRIHRVSTFRHECRRHRCCAWLSCETQADFVAAVHGKMPRNQPDFRTLHSRPFHCRCRRLRCVCMAKVKTIARRSWAILASSSAAPLSRRSGTAGRQFLPTEPFPAAKRPITAYWPLSAAKLP